MSRWWRRSAMLLAVASLAAACERGRPQSSAAQEVTVADDSLAVTLEASTRVATGSAVAFRLTVANTTNRQITLYLLGREVTWDVEVKAADGTPVWSRLDKASVQEILAVRPLSPREKLVLEARWPAAGPAGRYSATARILTDGEPLTSSPVSFEVR